MNQLDRLRNFLDLDKDYPRISRSLGLTAIGGSLLASGTVAESMTTSAVGVGLLAGGLVLVGGEAAGRMLTVIDRIFEDQPEE